jgi:hypothetical protein
LTEAILVIGRLSVRIHLVSIRFLFWNLKQLPLEKLVAKCAAEHHANVIVLTECNIDPRLMIDELTAAGCGGFTYPHSPAGETGDIRIFVQFPKSTLRYVYDDENNHVTIRRLAVGSSTMLLLAAVHLQSKMDWSDNDKIQGAFRLKGQISDAENKYPRAHTILVGDLNMNPFEPGVVGSEGLHGVMTARIAGTEGRIVDGEYRQFFYNPMWRFFGERPDGPPGTHYFPASGKPIAYYWNIFDQVLVRPSLAKSLEDVKILHSVRGVLLLDANDVPDTKVGSDHLPLLFSLRL